VDEMPTNLNDVKIIHDSTDGLVTISGYG
jgi:hypothetical protein